MARIHLTKRFEEKDIECWKIKASLENRDLTNWMETVLNIAVSKLDIASKKKVEINVRHCLTNLKKT